MRSLVEAVRLADQLTEARDTLRAVWGVEYETKVAWWRDLVRKAMAHYRCEALATVTKIVNHNKGKTSELGEVQTLWLIAAAADVAEGKA